jgi:hypothetical protein
MPVESPSRNSHNRLFNLLLCLTLVGQLTACRKLTADDLIGKWWFDYGKSTVALKLHEDGTFEEFFQKQGDTNTISRTGTWEMTEFEGPSVQLKGALVVRNTEGRIESDDPTGGWILRIDKSFSHFRLVASEDQGLYFEKSRE